MLVYCEENSGGSTTVKPINIKSRKDENTNTCRFDSLCIILFHADKRGNTRCYYINILRMVDIIFLRSALQLARCPQFTIQSDRQSSPAWFVARLSKHWLVTVLEGSRGVYTIQGECIRDPYTPVASAVSDTFLVWREEVQCVSKYFTY